MIKTQEIEGIILRVFETTNNAYILKVLSKEYSLLSIYAPYAKNSKRRYGQLDLFDWGIFTIKENAQGLLSLEEFATRSSFPNIRQSLDTIVTASLIAEVLEQISPEGELHSEQNFQILRDYLLSLEDLDKLTEVLKRTHLCLLALLTNSGIIEHDLLAKPSTKNFDQLITTVELYLDKRLKLREEVNRLIKKLKLTIG